MNVISRIALKVTINNYISNIVSEVLSSFVLFEAGTPLEIPVSHETKH